MKKNLFLRCIAAVFLVAALIICAIGVSVIASAVEQKQVEDPEAAVGNVIAVVLTVLIVSVLFFLLAAALALISLLFDVFTLRSSVGAGKVFSWIIFGLDCLILLLPVIAFIFGS